MDVSSGAETVGDRNVSPPRGGDLITYAAFWFTAKHRSLAYDLGALFSDNKKPIIEARLFMLRQVTRM